MPPAPAGQADGHGLTVNGHRLIGQPVLDVVRQGPCRGVAVLRTESHRLQADRLESRRDLAVDLAQRPDRAGLHFLQHDGDVLVRDRGSAGQQAVERCAQAVDVARRADLVEPSPRLLGAHVRGRPDGHAGQGVGRARAERRTQGLLDAGVAAGRFGAADDLGQPPVDDQGLAVRAQQDVGRLEIAVDHSAVVRVGDHITDGHEPRQEPSQRQPLLFPIAAGFLAVLVKARDLLLEALALDQPHGVERPALRIPAQAVDRDHAGMLQPPRDLGFDDEPSPVLAVVGLLGPDLLERNLAVKLAIQRNRNQAQTPLGIRPQDREPRAVLGRGAAGELRRRLGIVAAAGLNRTNRAGAAPTSASTRRSIARTIIGTYGGTIWAENRTGGGATFHFTLRLARAEVA